MATIAKGNDAYNLNEVLSSKSGPGGDAYSTAAIDDIPGFSDNAYKNVPGFEHVSGGHSVDSSDVGMPSPTPSGASQGSGAPSATDDVVRDAHLARMAAQNEANRR